MRFDEGDLCCWNITWFGVDKNGYIFECISEVFANVPEFVCKSQEETEFLEESLMEYLGIDEDDWGYPPVLSEKGLYSFGGIVEDDPESKEDFETHPYWYKKWGEAKNPLHFDRLPKNIQKIMDSHRIEVDITKTDYLYVEHAYNRGNNKMAENSFIGIKIPKSAPLVVALKIIRKYTHESYADIKSHILNNDYVFTCDYVDDFGLHKVITLYGEFTKAKIRPTVYEHGEKTTITFLKELAESHKEIDRYTEYIMDQESGDSEFETYEEFLAHYEDEEF